MNQQVNSQHYCLMQYFIEQVPPLGLRHLFGLVELNGSRHLIKSAAISWVDEPSAVAYSTHATFQLGQLITDDAEKFLYRRMFFSGNVKNTQDIQISLELCFKLH